jgi:hypothetical protein
MILKIGNTYLQFDHIVRVSGVETSAVVDFANGKDLTLEGDEARAVLAYFEGCMGMKADMSDGGVDVVEWFTKQSKAAG